MSTPNDGVYVHPSAFAASDARIGPGTKVWHLVQVREGAVIGAECILGKGVYVGDGVQIGSRVKIENGVSIYPGATVEDGVFIGPHVCFTNDRHPREISPDGSVQTAGQWEISPILIRQGASLGAACVLVAGVTVGRWALVAAGAVVTRDVPDFGLVAGNPCTPHWQRLCLRPPAGRAERRSGDLRQMRRGLSKRGRRVGHRGMRQTLGQS